MFIEKEISCFLAKKMGTCAPTKKPIMILYDVAHSMAKCENFLLLFLDMYLIFCKEAQLKISFSINIMYGTKYIWKW